MKILNLRNVLVLFSFTTSLLITSCSSDDSIDNINNNISITGEGSTVTQTLSIADLSGINLATSPNVTVKQGLTQEVKAIGQANIYKTIKYQSNK